MELLMKRIKYKFYFEHSDTGTQVIYRMCCDWSDLPLDHLKYDNRLNKMEIVETSENGHWTPWIVHIKSIFPP